MNFEEKSFKTHPRNFIDKSSWSSKAGGSLGICGWHSFILVLVSFIIRVNRFQVPIEFAVFSSVTIVKIRVKISTF